MYILIDSIDDGNHYMLDADSVIIFCQILSREFKDLIKVEGYT